MVIPSIDLMDGQTVQLVGGRDKALDAGDPRPILESFSLAGEVAVIDLNAAIGSGTNAEIVRDLLRRAPCRVGGGIRELATARAWLDAGAAKVILGTAARPEILRALPPERVIAAVDCFDGEVVVKGWRERTGRRVTDVVRELSPFVGGFLVTFVEREGRMLGMELDRVKEIIAAAGNARVTVAGGIASAAEIGAIDRLGADAQVGMALYTGKFELADAISAVLTTDRADGLWPTVVCDERGTALGLAYSSAESLHAAVRQRRGIYHSRTRGLWIKGESSGATQQLLRVDADCDRDALRFTVRQQGPGFCHFNTATCWGPERGLNSLQRTLLARLQDAPAGSYTRRLFDDPSLLGKKLVEEARELSETVDRAHVIAEGADVLYFTMVKLAGSGIELSEVERELDRRALKLTRRPGNAKPEVLPEPGAES